MALRVLEVLGQPVEDDWRAPWPETTPTPWRTRRQEDLRWARRYAMPYLRKWLRGQVAGEGFSAKRPELAPLDVPMPGSWNGRRATPA